MLSRENYGMPFLFSGFWWNFPISLNVASATTAPQVLKNGYEKSALKPI
jgi:hypothetical protein